MSLLDSRLRTMQRPPHPYLHAVVALLEEWGDGQITRAEVEGLLGLDANDTELTWLKNKYTASTDKPNFVRVLKRVLYLAELGFVYTTKAQIQARINGLP